MKKCGCIFFVLSVFFLSTLFICLNAGTDNIPPDTPESGDIAVGEEIDPDFMEIMGIADDPELIETLISDPDFMDVFEEFEEDLGIEEEDVPFELFGEDDAYSRTEDLLGHEEGGL